MSEFDEIDSMRYGKEKTEKLTAYYTEKVKVDSWLTNPSKNSIINFKDRTEYKKNGIYHRLNGPAIDYKDEKLDKYYYNGELYENVADWKKATIKELRKRKIKRLNKVQNNE
jgi:hypothetical protein